MRILLYALVTPKRQASRIRGVRGELLRLVTTPRLGALVGMVKAAPQPTAQALRAYHDVMDEISHRHAAMLPARFGALLDDDRELAFVMKSRRDAFLRLLGHVRGRVQMTVRIVGVAGLPSPPGASTPSGVSGAAYLRARASAQRMVGELPQCRAVRATVSRWVRDERIERQNRVVTVYHLVPRSAVERYRKAIAGLILTPEARVFVSGPFPPFAFADPFGLDTRGGAQPAFSVPPSGQRHG